MKTLFNPFIKLIKLLFVYCLLSTMVHANNKQLYFQENSIYNGQTALLYFKAKDISNPKLSLDKLHIDFLAHPKEPNLFFAFIPINYYTKGDTYRIIVSYIQDNEKRFKGINLNVMQKPYQQETIKVASSKIQLNKKDKARTQKEYKQAIKLYNTISSYPFEVQTYIYPLDASITSPFGTQRIYNDVLKSYHSGTDFKAKVGTPIQAVASGKVVLVQDRFYAGNSIVIDHGYGVYSQYYHLNEFLVQHNEEVKQGQSIAKSGVTGRVTGPHLHFSFRVHGIQVDPLQFIELANNLSQNALKK
jgi:murein DD-endopeptidase MepM/ murein hydrolase activator NlpD